VPRALILALTLLPLLLPPAPAAGAAVKLLSHRAAYRLELAPDEQGAVPLAVQGALVIEWRASCAGWLSRQRLGFVVHGPDGPAVSYDVRFSSWESRDGTRIRFALRSYDGSELFEEYRGRAVLEGTGRPGRAEFDIPGDLVLELPAGTIFPSEQMRRLVADARAGRRLAQYMVFDGSGPEGLSTVTAIIGQRREVRLEGGARGERWPVSLAYHRPGTTGAPEFEIAFELDDGGILHEVRLDYGEFALLGRLEKLEMLPDPECE